MDVPVKLEIFEGPLDLLLHLIRKNEVDIYDIPIALITRQYLEYLDLIRELNIGLAGEFLVMAATLTHIKSRMLLPSYDSSEIGEGEDDPRGDLVEALKEHLRIKDAADRLADRPWLDRDVFTRAAAAAEVKQVLAEGPEVISAGVFDLIEAFRRLLRGRGAQLTLSVKRVKVTLEERMGELLDLLRSRKTLLFEECFPPDFDRSALVVTFLALLELTRLGLLKVYQERTVSEPAPASAPAAATAPPTPAAQEEALEEEPVPPAAQAGPGWAEEAAAEEEAAPPEARAETEPAAEAAMQDQADAPVTQAASVPQTSQVPQTAPVSQASQVPQTAPVTPLPQAAWSPLRLYFNYKAQERWAETPAEREEDEQA